MTKTYTVTAECDSNMDWAITPDAIVVEFTETQLEKYREVVSFAKKYGIFHVSFYEINYKLYRYADGDEAKEQLVRLKPRFAEEEDFVEFDPSRNDCREADTYRIDSSKLKVYADGDLSIVLRVKHSAEAIVTVDGTTVLRVGVPSEEIWANLGKVDEITTND